jgi:integrase
MTVFRRKRNKKDQLVASHTWYGEFRDPISKKVVRLNLGVTHKDAAEEKLRQIKRERAEESLGMRPPSAMATNMRKPLSEHAQDYVRFLKGKERAPEYIYTVGNCLRIAFAGCGWVFASDATLDAYYEWRSAQTAKGKAAKTVREYQAVLSTFFKWLKVVGRIPFNPLENADRVPVDGRKKRVRRVLSQDEFQRLLDVSGERALAYYVVVNMGLRRGDGDALTWGDFELDGPNPCWISRAHVAKVPVETVLPLHPELAQALRDARPAHWQPNDKVFPNNLPSMHWFYKDLKAAGITAINDKGERVDLHALRTTFGTHLNDSEMPFAQAKKLMRHKYDKMTSEAYYRPSTAILGAALTKVPILGQLKKGTVKGTVNIGFDGPSLSRIVNLNHEIENLEPIDSQRNSPELSATGTDGPLPQNGCPTRIRT